MSSMSELRVKFSTKIPEIKFRENFQQSMMINSSWTRKEIIALIKKGSKYQGSKEFEIFVNNHIFNQSNQLLSAFLLEENISVDGKLIEISYNFQLEEPKLIDSLKQDEWIKIIKAVSNNNEFFTAGLFNSEINFFSVFNHSKLEIKNLTTSKISDDPTDYQFLNDYGLLALNKIDNCLQYLLIKAIRDADNALEFEEVIVKVEKSISKRKGSTNSLNKNTSDKQNKIDKEEIQITKSNSPYIVKNNFNSITKLDVNSKVNGLIATGTKLGDVKLYKVNNYIFSEQTPPSNLINNQNKKRKVEDTKQTLFATGELKSGNNEITAIAWMTETFFAVGDLETIKIINADNVSLLNQVVVNSHLVTSISSVEEKSLISSHDNGSIKLWDINAQTPLVHNISRAHRGYISKVSKVGNNPGLFVSSGYDGVVKLWDSRKLKNAYFEFPLAEKLSNNNYKMTGFDSDRKVFTFDFMNCKDVCGFNQLVTGGSSAQLDFYNVDF